MRNKLPTLIFFEDHNDPGVSNFLAQHGKSLGEMGYNTICYEIQNDINLSKFKNLIDGQSDSLEKQNIVRMLKNINTNKFRFVGIDIGSITHYLFNLWRSVSCFTEAAFYHVDLSFYCNRKWFLEREKAMATNLIKEVNNPLSKGIIAIVGVRHSNLQKELVKRGYSNFISSIIVEREPSIIIDAWKEDGHKIAITKENHYKFNNLLTPQQNNYFNELERQLIYFEKLINNDPKDSTHRKKEFPHGINILNKINNPSINLFDILQSLISEVSKNEMINTRSFILDSGREISLGSKFLMIVGANLLFFSLSPYFGLSNFVAILEPAFSYVPFYGLFSSILGGELATSLVMGVSYIAVEKISELIHDYTWTTKLYENQMQYYTLTSSAENNWSKER